MAKAGLSRRSSSNQPMQHPVERRVALVGRRGVAGGGGGAAGEGDEAEGGGAGEEGAAIEHEGDLLCAARLDLPPPRAQRGLASTAALEDSYGLANEEERSCNWMLMPLRRYAEFTGRSRRKEYWMWVLFNTLISTVRRPSS